ncbi:MAG: beta-ketoacyl-ACP synthase [Lentisphaeraceae bacterium]|nr:beta-ketoacyl-ACP synthase [Lentisphaeraceae bacterium]
MSVSIVDYRYHCNLGIEGEAFDKTTVADNSYIQKEKFVNGDSYVGRIHQKLPPLPSAFIAHDSRNNRLLKNIFSRMATAWESSTETVSKSRLGLVLGTSTSGMSDVESAVETKSQIGSFSEDYHFNKHEISSPSDFLRDYLSIEGPAYTVSTACTSGSIALLSAKRLIDMGVCDVVLCGGVDTLCDFTVAGFSSLEAVSAGRCQPFSANRDGINIGEGGALFILRKTSESDTSLALLGGGESSDAHHQSAPHPEGRGAIAAMQAALKNTGLSPEDIMYLNLHGTGTKLNDSMESKAVDSVFGEYKVPCSSSKSLTGHLLGGAGALEAAFCCETLQQKKDYKFPAQPFDGTYDEDAAKLNLVTKDQVSSKCLAKRAICMSSSYAFGGSNSVVVIGESAC